MSSAARLQADAKQTIPTHGKEFSFSETVVVMSVISVVAAFADTSSAGIGNAAFESDTFTVMPAAMRWCFLVPMHVSKPIFDDLPCGFLRHPTRQTSTNLNTRGCEIRGFPHIHPPGIRSH
jgi:hypothetical protein